MEKDFTTKAESISRRRKGRREYLNGVQTRHLMKQLNAFFETIVKVPRIRIGGRQTIETLVNEEALLLAKFLRDERETWIPRIALLQKHFACKRRSPENPKYTERNHTNTNKKERDEE